MITVMGSSEVMICQTCGSTGFSNALIKCTRCNTAVEHQYCLEKKLTVDEIMHWICRECKPKPPRSEVMLCTEMEIWDQEMKPISPNNNSQAAKISNQKTSAGAKFGSAQGSLDFIGDKSSCSYRNGYGVCHDNLDGFSPERIGNYLHSPIKQFETAKLSILDPSKSSHALSLTNDDVTSATSPYCAPSKFVCTPQTGSYEKSEFEATLLVENGGKSSKSSRKPCDCERFRRSRRRILLPEEDQLAQVHDVNIVGDDSRWMVCNENLFLQDTDSTSLDEQGRQVFVQKKRTFAWFEKESEPTIIDKNGLETLHANEYVMLRSVDHASAIGENDPGEHPDKFQAVSTRAIAEQVSLRQKRKLSKSYEDQSDDVSNIIDQDASKERFLADKRVSAVIHHAPMFQIDTPAVTCNRLQTASLQCNHDHLGAQAQPIMHHIWRGCFDVCHQKYGPLVAHLSSKACEKVWNTTQVLPPVLQMVKLSQREAWPKTFGTLRPTDHSIALYFFAQDDRIKIAVKELLGDIIKKDMMLKIVLDEAELLVFPSTILPEDSQRFQGEYYLWGAFRGREGGVTSVMTTSPSVENRWLKPLKELKELEMPKRQQRIGTLFEQVGDMKVSSRRAKYRKMWANTKAHADYQVGDLVLVKPPYRLGDDDSLHRRRNRHYEGPFLIIKKIDRMTYKLKIPQARHQHSIFHANLLELYEENRGSQNHFELTHRHRRPWKLQSSKNHEYFNRGGRQLERGFSSRAPKR